MISTSRRGLLALGLASAIAPCALAQPRGGVRRIGYLSGGSGIDRLAGPLAQLGWVEGRNLAWEIRKVGELGDAQYAAAAAELAGSGVDVLLAYLAGRVRACAQATKTVPIVFGMAEDPVGSGFVETLRRPGGNLTGLSMGLPEQASFRFVTYRRLLPRLARITLYCPNPRRYELAHRSLKAQATADGVTCDIVQILPMAEIERAMARMDPERDLVAMPIEPDDDVTFARMAAAAIRHRIVFAGAAQDGGLVHAYIAHADAHRSVALVIDKILRGARPADIPVELPDRPVIEVNLATARAIGVQIPKEVLLQATKVIG